MADFTDAQLEALTKVVAQGVQSVRDASGHQVTYMPASELLRLRERIKQELDGAGPAGGRPTARVSVFRR